MPCNGNYFEHWAEHVPDDDENARITDYDDVTNAFVVHIKSGSYRLSYFNGTFEIANKNRIWNNRNGLQKIICKVYWFCHRPPTKFPSIIVTEGNYEFEENYTGKVVRNIGR